MVALFLLFCTVASAHTLDHTDEAQVQASMARIKSEDAPAGYHDFVNAAYSAWKKKCETSNTDNCQLEECDITPESCRPNREVFFRGEDAPFATPATSWLLRSHWRNSRFSPSNSTERLLKKLADSTKLLVACEEPDQGDSRVLYRKVSGEFWTYYYKGQPANESDRCRDVISGNVPKLMEQLYIYHVQGGDLSFKDDDLDLASIDPMISFSRDPWQALRFAEKGRLIVISVPKQEISDQCGDTFPRAGAVWVPDHCEEKSQFSEEEEIDAFVYVKPEYIWKSYKTGGDERFPPR